MQIWLQQLPWIFTTVSKEMIQKSMEAKRFTESRRLINSTIVILLGCSLGTLLIMLILIRALASAYMPVIVSVSVYESFWMFFACFIVRQIWSDFVGRGLLLTFKRQSAYLKVQIVCSFLITLPLVFFNVFVIPIIIDADLFWNKNGLVRVWQAVLFGSSIQLFSELWLLKGYNIYQISTKHYSN